MPNCLSLFAKSTRFARTRIIFLTLAVGALLISATAPSAEAAGFTQGNIVVYRVGDGGTALSANAAPVFLDEYTPTGTLVQSISLSPAPASPNRQLTASGSATTEGFLTLSADGRFIVFTGYDATVGTAALPGTAASSVNRVVGRVDATGVVDTSTALNSTTAGFSGG